MVLDGEHSDGLFLRVGVRESNGEGFFARSLQNSQHAKLEPAALVTREEK